MPAVINGQVCDQLPEWLTLTQRALFYGDALFETIRIFDGRIPFMEQHWQRLSRGLAALEMAVPPAWSAHFWNEQIGRVASPNARVRLTVWRAPGGLYLPEKNIPQYLITTSPLQYAVFEWQTPGISIGLCDTVRLPTDSFSNLKTLDAPRYGAAARFARRNGWDDALLLNGSDHVCEATASNLFWWEGDTLCTVPLAAGCVAGVLRANLIEFARQSGYTVAEKDSTFAALFERDEIFLTNAIRGIIPVHHINGQVLANRKTKALFEAFVARIFDS